MEPTAPASAATASPAAASGGQDPGQLDQPVHAGFFTPWRRGGVALLAVAIVLLGILLARLQRPRRA